MTQKTTVEIFCDNCGTDIPPESTFWRASVCGHRDPEFGMSGGTPLQPDWMPNEDLPDTLDFCQECVPGVFGELIWKVAKERREAKNPAPEREPGGVQGFGSSPAPTLPMSTSDSSGTSDSPPLLARPSAGVPGDRASAQSHNDGTPSPRGGQPSFIQRIRNDRKAKP